MSPVVWGPSPSITAPPIIRGRPMCATEINKYLNRSATTEERKAYGRWRSKNPNVDLETGEVIERKPYDDDRFLPESDRSEKVLAEALGSPHKAAAVRALIEALIAEKA